MQISKKVPFDNPDVLNGVRALYVLSNVIIAGIYFYVQAQINKKNGACPSWQRCLLALPAAFALTIIQT